MNSTDIAIGLPARTRRPASLATRAWAGSVLVVGGLILVFFAGCFLIGVLGLLRPELFQGPTAPAAAAPAPLSGDERVLLYALYGLTFASVSGAAALLTLGLRAFWPMLARATGGED